MEFGIGLPTMMAATAGPEISGWAREAERRRFASLGVLDRIAYGNLDPLVALGYAAAVTTRVRLSTTVLIAPVRAQPVALAKQLASLQMLCGGRLVVGLGAGGRPDDYAVSGLPFGGRGARMDTVIETLREVWDGSLRVGGAAVGPLPPAAPRLFIGGHSDAAMRRAARYADGWIAGGGSAEPYPARAARLRAAWQAAGRTDGPALMGLVYFAVGPRAAERAREYLGHAYAGLGPYTERVIASAAVGPDGIRAAVREHAEGGCDELLFFPCAGDLGQLDGLADILDGLDALDALDGLDGLGRLAGRPEPASGVSVPGPVSPV